jgi:hypothetical protein
MSREEIVKAALDSPEELDVWQYDFINTIAEYDSLDFLTAAQVAGLEAVATKLGLSL